jgi:hypothetical protein
VKTKVTIETVFNFRVHATAYLKAAGLRTKTDHAIDDQLFLTEAIQKEHTKLKKKQRLKLASTDRDENILFDSFGLPCLTRDAAERLDAWEENRMKEKVEVELVEIPGWPKGISRSLREVLAPLCEVKPLPDEHPGQD